MYAKRVVYTAGIGGALFLLLPVVLFAADFRSGDQVQVSRTETVAGDLYLGGGTVTSAASILGDLFAGGGTVVVSGDVAQDVGIGGGSITITGSIGDDARVGGGTVVIEGNVAGDVVAGGGQISLSGERIGGDVAAVGGSIRIDSSVEGKVRIFGGEVRLNGPVRGDVEIRAQKLILGESALISGNLKYTGPKEAEMEEGAQILGEVIFVPKEYRTEGAKKFFAGLFSVFFFGKFLMLLTSALVVAFVFRRYTKEFVSTAYANPLFEFGRGLVAILLIPVISLLLLATVIGIPLGVLGILAFVALLIFSWILAPLLIGVGIMSWRRNDLDVTWKTILIGVGVFSLLDFVPIIGGLLQFGCMILALGTLVKIKWDWTKKLR